MATLAVRPSDVAELGVFTLEPLYPGAVVSEFKLLREVTEEAPLRPEYDEHPEHCPLIDGRFYLVASPERYLNHSCDPNSYLRFGEIRIDVVARRDVAANSDLTLDYLINNAGGDSWPCRCGVARCRGKTGHSFFTLPVDIQREYYPLLAPWFLRRYSSKLEHLTSEAERSG